MDTAYETRTCEACGKDWEREKKKGRPPTRCPDCQSTKKATRAARWHADAELAGTLYRKSKPYVAMLIARCVEPGHGEGNRPELDGSKVSLRVFAEEAGISPTTASKYLRTWQAMAAAGRVPDGSALTPGEKIDPSELPGIHDWNMYYRQVAAENSSSRTESSARKAAAPATSTSTLHVVPPLSADEAEWDAELESNESRDDLPPESADDEPQDEPESDENESTEDPCPGGAPEPDGDTAPASEGPEAERVRLGTYTQDVFKALNHIEDILGSLEPDNVEYVHGLLTSIEDKVDSVRRRVK